MEEDEDEEDPIKSSTCQRLHAFDVTRKDTLRPVALIDF